MNVLGLILAHYLTVEKHVYDKTLSLPHRTHSPKVRNPEPVDDAFDIPENRPIRRYCIPAENTLAINVIPVSVPVHAHLDKSGRKSHCSVAN